MASPFEINLTHQFKLDTEVLILLEQLSKKMDLVLANQETMMSTFEEVKATQEATKALVVKVKADVENLTAKIDAFPPTGMTPEQQAALDDIAAGAEAIRVSLSAVDDMTADPPPVA